VYIALMVTIANTVNQQQQQQLNHRLLGRFGIL
jgi:hypothetical protein